MQVFVSDSQYGTNLSTGFSIAICLDCLIPMFTNFHFLFGRFLRSWLVWLGILIVWKSSQQLPKSQNPAGAAGAGGFLRSLHLGRCTTYVELCMIHVHTCSYMFIHVHIPCYISLIFFDIISSLLKLIFPFRSPTCRSQICALPSGQLSMVCGDHRSPTFTKGFQFYSIFHHISIYFP